MKACELMINHNMSAVEMEQNLIRFTVLIETRRDARSDQTSRFSLIFIFVMTVRRGVVFLEGESNCAITPPPLARSLAGSDPPVPVRFQRVFSLAEIPMPLALSDIRAVGAMPLFPLLQYPLEPERA